MNELKIGKLTKQFDSAFEVAEGERAVVAKISTTTVDRDGDVLLPSGIDTSEFRENPVVLFGHNAGSIPIGKAVGLKTEPDGVVSKVVFAERPPEHPDAAEWVPDTILSLFKQKVLRAFSVGFMVPEGGIREADKKDKARFGDAVERIISRWKLLEFSVVPIPSNPAALATAVSKGLIGERSWTMSELHSLTEPMVVVIGDTIEGDIQVQPLEIVY